MAKVLDCIYALSAILQSISEFQNKFIFAYNEEDFLDRIKGLKEFPGIGVIYEGIHSIGETGPSGKVGVSGELVISIVLIDVGESIRRTDQNKTNCINLLDTIRSILMATRSPTGHYWRFLVEAPALLKNGMVFWTSRWSTPIQTTPTGMR